MSDSGSAKASLKVAVFNDTRPEKHYGCQLVMRNLLAGLAAHGLEPIWFWPVGKDWRPHAAELRRQPKIDAVIVNAEGSVHHTAVNDRGRYVAQVSQFAVEQLGAPAFLVNGTLEEIDSVAIEHLGLYRRVFVRDMASAALVAPHGIPAEVAPDLTFAADPPFPPPPAPRTGAGVTDSVFPETTAALRVLGARNGWEFRSMLDPLFSTPGSFVQGLQNLSMEQLHSVTADLRDNHTLPAFLEFIANRRLILTGRYHTATICFLTATPFLALESNTGKISYLLQDVLGGKSRLATLSDLQLLPRDAERPWSEVEGARISDYVTRARAQIDAMFASIRTEILSGKAA